MSGGHFQAGFAEAACCAYRRVRAVGGGARDRLQAYFLSSPGRRAPPITMTSGRYPFVNITPWSCLTSLAGLR